MPRLGLINILIGFSVVVIAAFAGVFNALTMTEGFLRDQAILGSWQQVLSNSAHGHSNLFGYLHIFLGLTLMYSVLPETVKRLQTIGLFGGVIAMGPLMLVKAASGPSATTDILSLVIGLLLSLALLSLVGHCGGIALRLRKKG